MQLILLSQADILCSGISALCHCTLFNCTSFELTDGKAFMESDAGCLSLEVLLCEHNFDLSEYE